MKGGAITGNTAANTTSFNTGGVYVRDTGSTFVMEGGSVSGNTARFDVLLRSSAGFGLTLSGNAAIGNLGLDAFSPAERSSVNVLQGWTGSVTSLNLRSGSTVMATVIGFWFNAATPVTLVQGAALTQADIDRFPLGNFITSAFLNTLDNTQAISAPATGAPNGFMLNAQGQLVARP